MSREVTGSGSTGTSLPTHGGGRVGDISKSTEIRGN